MDYKISSVSEQVDSSQEFDFKYTPIPRVDDSIRNYHQVTIYCGEEITYSGSVQEFVNPFVLVSEKVCSVFSEAISSLKNTIEYNGVYIAYLLDQLSEEEFEEEASKFIFAPQTELSDEILEKIDIFMSVAKGDFTPSDLADIFQIDVDVVNSAIQRLNNSICEI